jgi:hypothetical protein
MAKPVDNKKSKFVAPNPIEALGQILEQTKTTLTHEVFRAPDTKKVSGDLRAGESISFGNKEAAKQVAFERYLLQEEKMAFEEKTNQLRLELQAIMQEVQYMAKATANLGAEVKTAAFQSPINPGKYHLVFFEHVLETIKSFRKKIESAGVWLASVNKRAQKKGFWNQYKQQKSSFLLNPESYNARSAG